MTPIEEALAKMRGLSAAAQARVVALIESLAEEEARERAGVDVDARSGSANLENSSLTSREAEAILRDLDT